MKLLQHLAAMGLIAILGVLPAAAQTIRVGVFHKPSLVVAYVRSQIWAETLKLKTAELEAAKNANDAKKVQELKQWGGAQQERAHRQLTGEASITNILEALAPAFPAIAKKAQVPMIVADLPYAEPTVQTVDVTDFILEWLKADEATKRIARQLREQKSPLQPVH